MTNAYSSIPLLVLLGAIAASPATAQQPAAPDPVKELRAIKRQLAAMQKVLGGMRAQLNEDTATLKDMRASLESLRKDVQAANSGVRALQANSILDLNGYITFDNSSGYPTVLFNGINVQIVNGTGATQTVNGLGNLIVGYNRPRTAMPVCSLGAFATEPECTARGGVWARNHKSGSHNVIAGDFNGYSSWGGVVFGLENAIAAPYASVTGGAGNLASGDLSSVGAGSLNTASGMYGSVTGGLSNVAAGAFSSVGGGNARSVPDARGWAAGGLVQDQ
jgi:hypothetical protein